MSGGTVFSEPRPEPSHLIPALVGGLVLAIALPVFLVAGWNVAGWGLATSLYVAIHALNLLLAQLRERTSDPAASGVQAFGLFFKSLGLLVVLLELLRRVKRAARHRNLREQERQQCGRGDELESSHRVALK